MSYCRNCTELIVKTHETLYGNWPCECRKLKIGRNPDTYSCDKIVPKGKELENDQDSN